MSSAKKQSVQANQTVDEYINSLPKEIGAALEELRQAIKSVAPMAEEVISYRIPTYKYRGPMVHFMAAKNHCSFIPVSKSITEIFKDELRLFKISGTTIHFKPGHPLPSSLVKKIVKIRIKENEEGNNKLSKNHEND